MSKDFYPESKPHRSGHLDVGDGHKLYYEEFGNPAGIPIVYLHGGPGAGHGPYFHRFFDPKAFRIIIYDQRGAGQSLPFGETKNNSPAHCVADLEKLRTHLNIATWHVFGGSWGSTFALLYAQNHPDKVKSLTLRGIFLMRQKELDFLYKQADMFFPQELHDLKAYLPENERGDVLSAYYNRIVAGDAEAARRWSRFESATCHLIPATPEDLDKESDNFLIGMATMETHFFVNHKFQPEDLLLRDVHKIRHIPTHIVQGHYDVVCPPVTAWELHRAFPESTMETVIAGHSATDPEIKSALIRATERIRDLGSPVLPQKPKPAAPKPPAP